MSRREARVRRVTVVTRGAVTSFRSAVIGVALALTCDAAYGVNVTISPPAVQNDQNTVITFSITGLATGQTVRVDQYADLNGNGAIDPGEPLVRSFTVTDGELPIIAGVRNLNVPGDDDGEVNGQITAKVPSPGFGAETKIAGTYIFKISDPTSSARTSSSFTPVLVPFRVMQDTGLPQGVSGTVTAADTGQPLQNGMVLFVAGTHSSAGTFSDANGHYAFYAPPHSYSPAVALAPGFVDALASVVLEAHQFITFDFALPRATFTVTGTLTDMASGAAISGIPIIALSSLQVAAGFSDASGNYTVQVTTGQWNINPDSDAAVGQGYVGVYNDEPLAQIQVNGNTTTVNLTLPKATALIYGTVTDEQNDPVTLVVDANEQGSFYRPYGQSFGAGGSYTIGVLAGTWNVGPDFDDMAAAGCSNSNPAGSITISDGQAVRQDFTLQCTPGPATPTPVPTMATPIPCTGDCNGDGSVTIDEILTLVNIVLGNAGSCPNGVPAGTTPDISLILQAVNNVLNGCAAPRTG